MPKRTSTTAYKRARTELLRERPMCHWCKKRPATEADHLLEHDAGGDDTIANLVPACKTCNARRGARYGNAKRQRRKPTQPKQQRQPSRVRLDAKATRPRRPSISLSPKNKTESIRNGHDLPRLETIVSDAVGTYGPDVEKWALQHLNVTFMPWQRRVLAQQLSYDKDGRWCNRVALISTARRLVHLLKKRPIGLFEDHPQADHPRPQHPRPLSSSCARGSPPHAPHAATSPSRSHVTLSLLPRVMHHRPSPTPGTVTVTVTVAVTVTATAPHASR